MWKSRELNALSSDRSYTVFATCDWQLFVRAMSVWQGGIAFLRASLCGGEVANRTVTKEGGASTLGDARLLMVPLMLTEQECLSKLLLAGTTTSYCLPLWCFSWRMRGSHLASHRHHICIANHRCFHTTFFLWDNCLLDFELGLIASKNWTGGGKEIPSLDKLFRGSLVFEVWCLCMAEPTYRSYYSNLSHQSIYSIQLLLVNFL